MTNNTVVEAEVVATPAAKAATKPATLTPIADGFDLTSVRCAVETRLDASIRKDEKLFERIKGMSEQMLQARVRSRLELMTDGYRVDEAITPKLSRLGVVLTKALRLVHPLDIFVRSSHECNAFCLPSRKGNRLIMCLYSGLLGSLTSQELLFVMGHEVGHAILKHGETLSIGFDDPNFSPLEVVRAKALERAREISCDRFGLLACQDLRVASTALFKVTSGLSDRWISFDETAYSRHFDELSSMSELVDLEDASRTHPLTPLRVKALIAFSNSESYAKAFEKTSWNISAAEMERGVETMLSVLDPDVSELESTDEKEAANRFLFDGALLVIGADGVVGPQEVAWLDGRTEKKWSGEDLARDLANPEFQRELRQRLDANASILRNKLPELARAQLLHVMCDVALSAGGIPDTEFESLDEVRRLLKISVELAQSVLSKAKSDAPEESDDDAEAPDQQHPAASLPPPADPLEAILQQANLPEAGMSAAKAVCDELRSKNVPLVIGIRTLVSWAIGASRKGGQLREAQGKKIAVAAIRVCREIQDRTGVTRKARATPVDKLTRQFGVVALFCRNETVYLGAEDRPHAILSVSRSKGSVVIAPVDDLQAATEVDARDLRKDPVHGDWPAELSGI